MEKRTYPRITASFPIRITPDIIGETVDISETGLGFILDKPLLLSKASAKIEFSPKESIETEFKVIWNKHLIEKKGLRYGACFIRLKEKDISILRDVSIRKYIKPIVDNIEDSSIKQKVIEFWTKDCEKYINQIDSLTKNIKKKAISLEDACKKTETITDNILQKGDKLESLLADRIIVKKIKETFRLLCGPWAYKGKIVKRAFEKPRGYPGDYLMLEAIYDNKSVSEDIGYCADMYILNNKYAIAVRNRKDMMKDILIDYISNNFSSDINILNIACGSCREIAETFSSKFKPNNKVNFSLVDHDEEALVFSKKVLGFIKSEYVNFKFLQHNVLKHLKEEERYINILGKYDLVYTIGLPDYVPDKIFKRLISFWFKLLKPKGSLILAHKDTSIYKPISTDWWADWTFFPRDEKNLLSMISECEINNFDLKVEREKSNLIMFLTITKK